MDRERVFPDFDDAWIVYEDEFIIAIDKPEGIPTQSADPTRPDDLVTRLRRHLEAQGKDPYLGTHQRLDRDTSGVILFTRDKSVNQAIAAQFEGRSIRKRYLAAVHEWRGRDAVTLDDWLLAGEGGRMDVVRPPQPAKPVVGRFKAGHDRPKPPSKGGPQRARTHVKVLERREGRALLTLELETGRTHQARVQLAHAGSPIAGDVIYGIAERASVRDRPRQGSRERMRARQSGHRDVAPEPAIAAAPRLMLHAARLELKHPKTGRPLVLEAPAPPEFRAWLEHGDPGAGVFDDVEGLDRALRRALVRRYGLGRSSGERATTAFRLVNEDGDGVPRLAVDVYGEHLVAQFYGTDGPWADLARRERVLDRLAALGFDGVYLKIRPKQANTLVDPRREEIAPREPVRGLPAREEFPIVEEGVEYLVRPGDGLSTGIFLDQRANRVRVRELAKDAAVLNLFSYTCGFSVAAAAGGAKRTVSVDASAAILERGRSNFVHHGFDLARHSFVADDAFSYLAKAKHKREAFELVVLDPPSYSTTKSRRFVAESDYVDLAAAAIAVVARGGRLLACTNHRGIGRDRFRRLLFEAARKAGRDARQIKDLPDPSDYPVASGQESHLKSALVTFSL